jgi:hypothetical protein
MRATEAFKYKLKLLAAKRRTSVQQLFEEAMEMYYFTNGDGHAEPPKPPVVDVYLHPRNQTERQVGVLIVEAICKMRHTT